MYRCFLLACTAAIALSGCLTTQSHELAVEVKPETMREFLADKPVAAHRLYARVLQEGDRNAVLNHFRSGLAAFELGEDSAARASFDKGLSVIESNYVNSENAEAARSIFTKENRKDFKGEPYERAMANYYRGLLFLREGSFDNAAARFKNGLDEDTWAEDQRYKADFASLTFLEAWARRCYGNASMASDMFKRAAELKQGFSEPPSGHNALLIAEIGTGPRKVGKGEYKELLTFIPGSYSESGAEFEIGTSKVTAASAEDLFWQATTRGGRQIDAINAGKAQFKDTAGTVGDVAIGAGTGLAMAGGLSGNRDMQGAAAIIGLIGLMAKAAEAAARPEADVRYWDNLPAQILIATTEIRPGSAVRGRFLPAGSPVTLKVSTATSQSPSGRACSLVWMRSPSAFAVPDSAPGAVAAN